MDKKAKAAIFDLDGTLLDTLSDLTAGVNFALEKQNFPKRTREEVRSFIGNGVPTLVRRSLKGYGGDFEKALSDFTDYYMENIDTFTKPYAGICEMLQRLRDAGIFVAAVSNKKHEAVVKLCEKFFGDLIIYPRGVKEERERKPDPYMLIEAVKKAGADEKSTVYSGDSDVDIMTGNAANVKTLAVGWGYRDESSLILAGADEVFKTPQALCKKILSALNRE